MTICFDYLSFTFSLKSEDFNVYKACLDLCKEVADKMGFSPDELFEQKSVLNGFKYGWSIGEFIVFRGLGEIRADGRPSCQVELKGQGCRELEERNYCTVMELIIKAYYDYQSNFTRIDLAIDDYTGKYSTIAKIERKLTKGYYTSSFRTLHNRNGNAVTGYTLYLGTTQSTQQLCIYDKLKERQANGTMVLIDFWTRYEMRFKRDKANALASMIVENDVLDINEVVFSLLRDMLDLKVDNKYGKENQCRVKTCDWWQSFLNNASKLKLNTSQFRTESTITSKENFREKKLSKMDLSIDLARIGIERKKRIKIIEEKLEAWQRITAKDLFIINKDRKKSNLKELTNEELTNFLQSLNDELESLKAYQAVDDLPF